jgi:hypothetical protein
MIMPGQSDVLDSLRQLPIIQSGPLTRKHRDRMSSRCEFQAQPIPGFFRRTAGDRRYRQEESANDNDPKLWRACGLH